MGANRYWCENSFGAIKKFLWIEIGHFVAIFLHFWAFLVTLMAVATTILLTLGTGCTKRLLRHMGWWYGTIFALLSHIASAGWGQKWLIFEVKIRSQWQASSRAGNQPGNRFMCHINWSLKWGELWSQQPWEWPKKLKNEEKWPQNG